MKTKIERWIVAFAIGSAFLSPPAIQAAEKDMMKDEKGMMEKA